MSTVPFLRFPPSIQHQIVRDINLRELVKFSFCSKRCHKIVQAAKVTLYNLESDFFEDHLDMKLWQRNADTYEIYLNDCVFEEDTVLPEYIGFEGRRMTDAYQRSLVIVPDKDLLEVCDRFIGYLKGLFESVEGVEWDITSEEQIGRIVQKHFPRIGNLTIYPADERKMTMEEARLIMEDFEVSAHLDVISEVEEGYVYSTGFQQDIVTIENSSWVHIDAVINSKSKEILLSEVRSLFSADLNRLLKLWVSMEKVENLANFPIYLDSIEGLEFPADFLDLVLEGIPDVEMEDESDELDPEHLNTRRIMRVDGKTATVNVDKTFFSFETEV